MKETFLTTQELADRWHTTVGSLAVVRCRGAGPKFIKLGHKKVLYRLSDILEYEAERERTNSAGIAV
ncbi:helix-turn-helix transcriptional regulator [Shimia aestuarii]|uniref:Helix-turn-helix domain-containing protein n=1 Tax=Shimia aestuarii TaxID=254406 RepID=A0A1I4HS97_9RHOB|nr:hypothetical protein [Shimia aestuarii]SFL45022.1 hypothetical protein SAMN04488042_101244 [Shimia aestuarii]